MLQSLEDLVPKSEQVISLLAVVMSRPSDGAAADI